MRSALMLLSISPRRWRKRSGAVIMRRLYCFGCGTVECSAANRVAEFTDTKAKRKRLTSRLPNGDTDCMVNPKGPKGQTFPRIGIATRDCDWMGRNWRNDWFF